MRLTSAVLIALCVYELIFIIVTLLTKDFGRLTAVLTEDSVKIEVQQKKRSFFPMTYKAGLAVENIYTGEKTEIKTKSFGRQGCSISLDEVNCGVLKVYSKSVYASAGTFLFRRKTDLSVNAQLLVMPEAAERSLLVSDSQAGTEAFRKSSSGEPDGAREYHSGDRMRDIHMKLSAKAGKYMVRERSGESEHTTVIKFEYADTVSGLCRNAEQLLGDVYSRLEKGNSVIVEFGGRQLEIYDYADVRNLMFAVFSDREKSE